jgi:hypothetical protein
MRIDLQYDDPLEAMPMFDDEFFDLVVLHPEPRDWDKLCEEGLICQAVRCLKMTGNLLCLTRQPYDFNLRGEVNNIFHCEIICTDSCAESVEYNEYAMPYPLKIYWCVGTADFYYKPARGFFKRLAYLIEEGQEPLTNILVKSFCPKGGKVLDVFADRWNVNYSCMASSCIAVKTDYYGIASDREGYLCCVEKLKKECEGRYELIEHL